jgi:heptosyltransferase II
MWSARVLAAPQRLLVIAPNWLGDAVMALPLVADIRRGWPDAAIVVAARRSVAPLFAMVPGVASTIALEGGGGIRALSTLRRNTAAIAAGGFDAALVLPNSFHTAFLVARAGIRERWGYARDLRARLLTRPIPRPAHYEHQVSYYQALGTALGLMAGESFACIDVGEEALTRARETLVQSGISAASPFVLAAPGAAYGRAKQWLPERFAELAGLLSKSGAATVLIGSKADARACREVLRLAVGRDPATRVVDLAGQTSLASLAGLAALSVGVVANDSGAMHLAAAAGARVVAVFGPTDFVKTSPLRAGPGAPEPQILWTDVWCRPCMLRECPIDHRCMTGVRAHAVFEALRLEGRP